MDIISKYQNFFDLGIDEKLEIKQIGRPTPEMNLECVSLSRGKKYVRKFNTDIYAKFSWICGCPVKNRLFCFTCLLFGGDKHWSIYGVDDLGHIAEKAKQHASSRDHLTNAMKFILLGTTNIQEQLDCGYKQNVAKYNETVAKNRFVLTKVIDAIRFCDSFELALRGHDESETFENPGIFQCLINYSAELDKILKKHPEITMVFKGTSKEIQNDLLDCIFEVYREEVSTEINNASFLGVIADETTDVSTKLQTVIVFRYVHNGKPVERFWGFFTSSRETSEVLSSVILAELDPLVGRNPNKLIAQSYDGSAVMSGKTESVQAKIREKYPLAYFVYCFAQQLSLTVAQATSQNTHIGLFFSNLSEIPVFFSNSIHRAAFLDKIDPRFAPTTWSFENCTVNVVYEYREELIEYMEEIEENLGTNNTSKNQASAIRRMLQEKTFLFWLTFFHNAMPYIDVLFNELQKRIIDSGELTKCLKKFTENISCVKNHRINDIVKQANCVGSLQPKRRRPNQDTWKTSAIEACDSIIAFANDRFECTERLDAANLFISEKFQWYAMNFPEDYFLQTVKCYPVLERRRLKTELKILYSSCEYRNFASCAILLNFIVENKLQEVFQETIKLLDILVTIPMTTVEAERNFSTLKRINTFLRSAIGQDRLNALACLSIERKFIQILSNFSERVIDKLSLKENRWVDLVLKK